MLTYYFKFETKFISVTNSVTGLHEDEGIYDIFNSYIKIFELMKEGIVINNR